MRHKSNCGVTTELMPVSRHLQLLAALTALAPVLIITVVIQRHPSLITGLVASTVSRSTDTLLLVQQRDNLSRQLNLLQERHQQLVCRTRNQSTTSETGGWCNIAVHGHHVTDKRLAAALTKLFTGRTVVGLGDGRGEYRKLLLRSHMVKAYDAYDGAPYISNITAGQVKFMDLTLAQYWLPRYDWVLSLEVLEHIPATYEQLVLDNVDRAAGLGVVLSWARIGQGGFYHVNNRSPAYVNQTMFDRGFTMDSNTSLALRREATLPWLKRNIMVFRRRNKSP